MESGGKSLQGVAKTTGPQKIKGILHKKTRFSKQNYNQELLAASASSEEKRMKADRRTDYVIVVDRHIKTSQFYNYVVKFLNYLQVRGIKVELGFGNVGILFLMQTRQRCSFRSKKTST